MYYLNVACCVHAHYMYQTDISDQKVDCLLTKKNANHAKALKVDGQNSTIARGARKVDDYIWHFEKSIG